MAILGNMMGGVGDPTQVLGNRLPSINTRTGTSLQGYNNEGYGGTTGRSPFGGIYARDLFGGSAIPTRETSTYKAGPTAGLLASGGIMTPAGAADMLRNVQLEQARQDNQNGQGGYSQGGQGGYRVNPYMMDLSDLGYDTTASYQGQSGYNQGGQGYPTQGGGQNYSQQYIQSLAESMGGLGPLGGQTNALPVKGDSMGVVDPTTSSFGGGAIGFKSPVSSGILGGGTTNGIMDSGVGNIVGDIPVVGDVLEGVFNPGGGAADAYTQAMNNAMRQQEAMTERGATFQQPYVQGGGIGMEQLMRGAIGGDFDPGQFGYKGEQFTSGNMANWQEDPSYQYMLDQSEKAIDRAAAAGGRFGGGATARALQENAQNLGSQQYQNIYNRRANEEQERYRRAGGEYLTEANRLQGNQNLFRDIAGIGQGSANNLTNVYGGLGNQLMQSTQSVAEAQAAAQAAAQGAQNDILASLLGAGMNYLPL